MRKIVIAGGTGFLGTMLARHFKAMGDEVVVLTRGAHTVRQGIPYVQWNGETVGTWAQTLEHATALINLVGKSVDCRYTRANKKLIYDTRLNATRALGQAVQACSNPPAVWINAASATIYRHSLDREMDEETGEIGTGFSVDVCLQWEAVFNSFSTPATRKVCMRTGIVLGKQGGPLKPLTRLARLGLGGRQGSGEQYFSWLHEVDFVAIVKFLVEHASAEGVYNVTAPVPVPNKQVMQVLRKACKVAVAMPLPAWLLELGAVLIQTETELVLKSRRVVPRRLLEAGFRFSFRTVEEALPSLV